MTKENYQECFVCDCYVPMGIKKCESCGSDRLFPVFLSKDDLELFEAIENSLQGD